MCGMRVPMVYLKMMPNEFKNASRDKREMAVAKELGYKVVAVATTKQPNDFCEICDGYDVFCISTRRVGMSKWLRPLNRALAFVGFIAKAIEAEADIVSGHDYVATLAAYIANCFNRRKAKIIYDSHEFELYQNPKRSKMVIKFIKLVEGFLLRRVDLTLMVGDKIADGVQEIYGLNTRPTVVRNIPSYWLLEIEKSEAIRRRFLEKLSLPDAGILLMYHGGVSARRGIEYGIRALASLPKDVGMIIMGQESEEGAIDRLRILAEAEGVANRVLFHPAVSTVDLGAYIGASDVELVLQSSQIEEVRCVNILYSLPNKFFESIQACVPLICCDMPEMEKLVKQYDIGIVVKENDVTMVAEAVLRLREDKALYARLKKNMKKTKRELCWEKESVILKAAIRKMIGEP